MGSKEEGKRLSRRQALARGAQMTGALVAAGAVGGYGLPEVFAAAEKKRRRNRATRLGFTTYLWGKAWDIPTLIKNCTELEMFGVELRTMKGDYAHGVETSLNAAQRAEVKKQFADSRVRLVGLASGCEFDSPDPEILKKNIEEAKAQLQLSSDVGSRGVRVFPNAWHAGVDQKVTIAQIAKSLNEIGKVAADLGQLVRLECHGSIGRLPTMRDIMLQVDQESVRVKLNSSKRDTEGEGFEHNFNLVKPYLGDTLHLHDLKKADFPYQEQMNLLVKMGWTGWQLLELDADPTIEDKMAALKEFSAMWHEMLEKAQAAAAA